MPVINEGCLTLALCPRRGKDKEVLFLGVNLMKIHGLIKVRDEEMIIKDTLDHWGEICTGGIYIYDDVSTDNTVRICRKHRAVRRVIEGKVWDPDREKAEWYNRQQALLAAKKKAKPDDWFVYFDADERLFLREQIRFDEEGVKAVACRLYDVFITPEDVNKHYMERDWVDPQYRQILFFFKNSPAVYYGHADQREAMIESGAKIAHAGVIKHYGKSLSVEHWEETCDYYSNYFPKYSEKWRARKGKAIKWDFITDTGRHLIRFSDVLSGANSGNPAPEPTIGSKDVMP